MPINVSRFDNTDAPCTVGGDPRVRPFALLFRELFAVRNVLLRFQTLRENTGTCYNWTCESPAACFVEADDDWERGQVQLLTKSKKYL